jgi:hypothetical protein
MRVRAVWQVGLAGLTVLLAGACASAPTGPSVLVLPGEGKSHEQFRADDARCRQPAAAEIQAPSGGYVSAQARYDMVYVQCMYSAGHQVPVPGGRLHSRDVPPPAPGPPPPPPAASTPRPPPPAGTPPPPPR